MAGTTTNSNHRCKAKPQVVFIKTFLIIFLITWVSSVVVTFVQPEMYAGTVRIIIERSGAYQPREANHFEFGPGVLKRAFGELQSEAVLKPVIESLNLNVLWGKRFYNGQVLDTAGTLKTLKRRIRLSAIQYTPIVTITACSEDKIEAPTIANAIGESYKKYRLQLEADRTAKAIQVLKGEFKRLGVEIQRTQADVELLRQTVATNATDSQSPEAQAYRDKQRRLESMTALLQVLGIKVEQTDIDQSNPPSTAVTVTDPAVVSEVPAWSNKLLNIAIGAIAGIFLGAIAGGMVVLVTNRLRKRSGNALIKS